MPTINNVTLYDLVTRPLRDLAPPQWYKPLYSGLAHLLVLQLPRILVDARRGGGTSLNREFKVVVVENEAEVREAEQLMDRPLTATAGGVTFMDNIDIIAGRRTQVSLHNPMVLHYHTEASGWPHYVVSAMPDHMLGFPGLVRGRYGYEPLSTQKEAMRSMQRFAKSIPIKQRIGMSDKELAARAR